MNQVREIWKKKSMDEKIPPLGRNVRFGVAGIDGSPIRSGFPPHSTLNR